MTKNRDFCESPEDRRIREEHEAFLQRPRPLTRAQKYERLLELFKHEKTQFIDRAIIEDYAPISNLRKVTLRNRRWWLGEKLKSLPEEFELLRRDLISWIAELKKESEE